MSAAQKPMRQAMPTVAHWIDELRAVFGADMINNAIRNGMAGGTDFYARENGHQLGHPMSVNPEKVVSLTDIPISPMKPKGKPNGRY